MVFKLRPVFLSLIFLTCFFLYILWAAKSIVPLPPGSLMVSKNTANFGPIKSVTRIYQSSLAQGKVEAFYKKEMLQAGWRGSQEEGFIKNNYIVVVMVDPLKDKAGRINFSYTISNIPAKEEFLSLSKIKLRKLNFMPVYPGSVQVFLWDSPLGVSGSYETESSIKEVVFFYKSAMLNYGWSLDNEMPIATAAAKDCPECRQAARGASSSIDSKDASVVEAAVRLSFSRKDAQSCTIKISSIAIGAGDLLAMSKADNDKSTGLPGKTSILINYNAYKRIK